MSKEYKVDMHSGMTVAHFGERFNVLFDADWDVLSKIASNVGPTPRDWESVEPEREWGICDISSRAAYATLEPKILQAQKECSEYALHLGYLEAMTEAGLTFCVDEKDNKAKMQLSVENETAIITRDLNGFFVRDKHDTTYTCFKNPTVIENTEDFLILKFPKEQ